ncbi:MAG: ABC transporter substrate-binding protein [Defluviimonas sp.]|nr:ABC transporter substrate-binding protein [Defluviimonas sp.]
MNRFVQAAIGLVVAMAPLMSSPARAEGEEIVIPAITAMSGSTAVLGQDAQKGIEIAVEHINADGGINGRPLKIQVYDTQGEPGVVRQVMERLTRMERAPIILGCEVSAGTSAAAQFAEQAGVPYLNSSAVSAELLERGYKWYFSDQITADSEAATVVDFVEHLMTQGEVVPALLYEDSPRGAGTIERVEALLKDRGIEIAASASYSRSDRNLLPPVKRVQTSGANVVIWAGYTEDVVAGLQAMQQLDFKPYIVGIGGGPGDVRIPQLVDKGFIEAVNLSTADYFNPDMERAQRFVKSYEERHGIVPSSYASMCYRGAYTLKAALEKTLEAGKELTPENLRGALIEVDIPGEQLISPFSRIKFDEHGRNIGAQNLIAQWKDGATKKVTVWPPEVAVEEPNPLN